MRFVIFTNELPRILDASGALPSRFVIWTQTKSFYGEEDLSLIDTLRGELPGILNWALEGIAKLAKRPYFNLPKNAEETMRLLEALSSPVGLFIDEWCKLGPNETVRVSDLFKAWEQFCEQENIPPESNLTFGRNVHARVPGIRKKGRNPTKRYHGIGLRPHPDAGIASTPGDMPNYLRHQRKHKEWRYRRGK